MIATMAEEEKDENRQEMQKTTAFSPTERPSIERKTVIVGGIIAVMAISYLVTTIIGMFIDKMCLFASVEEGFLIMVLIISRIIGFGQVRLDILRAITSMDTSVFGDKAVISKLIPNILTPRITFAITAIMIVRFFCRLLSFMVWGLLVAETLLEVVCISAGMLYVVIWYVTQYVTRNHPDLFKAQNDSDQKNSV